MDHSRGGNGYVSPVVGFAGLLLLLKIGGALQTEIHLDFGRSRRHSDSSRDSQIEQFME